MSDYYENLPEVLQVRVDKYNKLCGEGRYPYKETRYTRTVYAKDILEPVSYTHLPRLSFKRTIGLRCNS